MTNFELYKADYTELLPHLATELNASLSQNFLSLPNSKGEGFIWAEKLPCGISVIVSETSMNEDFKATCKVSGDYSFCLQFNDAQVDSRTLQIKENRKRNADLVQTSVKLTDTSTPITYSLPAGITLRSVKIFFDRDDLLKLLGRPEIEHVINQYFTFLIKNESLVPIDTVYRVTLDELLLERINHPLRLNYIQNRVLYLIEKFILKLHSKKDLLANNKSNEDEITRLMRVEAILVKDFSVSPPTILELSKISAMSPTKLKTDFKSLYGLPIYEYYQKNRMLKAKSLLLLAKYSIKEVGTMVGYSNLSHFANTFKKEFNILPSELTSKDGLIVYNS